MNLAEKFNHDFKCGGHNFSLYDSNGNEIYFETSTGFWFKKEYDSDGNLIYWENKHGVIEDNRPTQTGTVIEIDGKKYVLKEV